MTTPETGWSKSLPVFRSWTQMWQDSTPTVTSSPSGTQTGQSVSAQTQQQKLDSHLHQLLFLLDSWSTWNQSTRTIQTVWARSVTRWKKWRWQSFTPNSTSPTRTTSREPLDRYTHLSWMKSNSPLYRLRIFFWCRKTERKDDIAEPRCEPRNERVEISLIITNGNRSDSHQSRHARDRLFWLAHVVWRCWQRSHRIGSVRTGLIHT